MSIWYVLRKNNETINRKARGFLRRILELACGLPLLLLVILLRPMVTVSIGRLRSQRIGSFVGDVDRHLVYRRWSGKRSIELFFMDHKDVCNAQIEKMWRREIRILPRLMLVFPYRTFLQLSQIFPRFRDHLWSNLQIDHWSPILGDRDPWNLLDSAPPTFSLSEKERNRGMSQLLELGVQPQSRIALLIGRDAMYGTYRGDVPHLHSHRNVSINDFEESINQLRLRGYLVFRMGSRVNEPLRCADDKAVFDYATNGIRSEFLDVYLASVCRLCISVSTGYDALATLFRKPTCYVDVVPVGMYMSFRNNAMVLCKSFKDRDSGEFLTLNELHQRGCFFALQSTSFEAAGVDLIDNSPDLLSQAIVESVEHLVENAPWSSDDTLLWGEFRNQFEPLAASYPIRIHGELRSRYSPSGLRHGQFGIAQPKNGFSTN